MNYGDNLMATYIGAKVGMVTANAADIKGDISATDTPGDNTKVHLKKI